jgi:hypothetical protein
LRKFQIRCKALQFFFVKILNNSLIIMFTFGIPIIYLKMYFSQEDRFYLLIILFWYPIGVYSILKVMPTLSLTAFMGCATLDYLTMRYQQINQQFKTITNKNLNSLEALIKAHNEVTVMVKECDLLFNKFLGVGYFYSRYLVNLYLFLSIYGNSLIYSRNMASVIAVFAIIVMYLICHITAKVSIEAHRCYNTINSIIVRNKIPILTKLKVRLFFKIALKIYLIMFLISYHFHC